VKVTLDWLGVATFRLQVDGLVVFLDAYMDRVPSAPPVGMSSADVERADFVLVGHSHFDHLHGAQHIAKNTGARVIGSHETYRVLRAQGVAKEQLVASQGGERHRLAEGVTVRVFPSLHSCTWCAGTVALDEELRGDEGLTEDERATQSGLVAEIMQAVNAETEEGRALREHLTSAAGSRDSGGALVYFIETPAGSMLFQDTSGCWSGVLRELRPDVTILAAAGRGNLDGEPYQGSLAQFIAHEAALLQPEQIVIGHHDDWMPPVTRDTTDVTAIRKELARAAPHADLVEMGYLEGVRLFA
jgi:L-ascorbate metabolism protein UlaG (beta-lactamase superfamily)